MTVSAKHIGIGCALGALIGLTAQKWIDYELQEMAMRYSLSGHGYSPFDTLKQHYPNGAVQYIIPRQYGEISGQVFEFTPDSVPLSSFGFEHNVRHGQFMIFDENGVDLVCRGRYQEGNLIEFIKYENGDSTVQQFSLAPTYWQ